MSRREIFVALVVVAVFACYNSGWFSQLTEFSQQQVQVEQTQETPVLEVEIVHVFDPDQLFQTCLTIDENSRATYPTPTSIGVLDHAEAMDTFASIMTHSGSVNIIVQGDDEYAKLTLSGVHAPEKSDEAACRKLLSLTGMLDPVYPFEWEQKGEKTFSVLVKKIENHPRSKKEAT